MYKKMSIIATISILILCLISSIAFATSGTVTDGMDDASNSLQNDGRMVGNMVQDDGQIAGNIARDGADAVGDAVEDGYNTLTQNMMDENTPVANGIIDSQTLNDVGEDAKNATDTMTTDNVLTNNNMLSGEFLGISLSVWMWILLIIIIVAVIIIVCKYMKDHDDYKDDDE